MCSKLKYVQLPSSLNLIEKQAFALNPELTEILLPVTLTKIKSLAFQSCPLKLTKCFNESWKNVNRDFKEEKKIAFDAFNEDVMFFLKEYVTINEN
jgi:hypothetical protein